MKAIIKSLLPPSVLRFMIRCRERQGLEKLATLPTDISHLSRSTNKDEVRNIFRSSERAEEWNRVALEINSFSIVETAGGVNLGDRRAIYYLLRHLRPTSVLEIGTHIGASTVHAIAALRTNRQEGSSPAHLTSLDILDVNDPRERPWVNYGAQYSPKEMTERMGASDWVRFVVSPSLGYFATTRERFDLIFLDGDHSAGTVYQEIPAALSHLNDGGLILLHDYFPDGKALWGNHPPLLGPWMATKRLISEGSRFRILPLGELPWKTKLNSTVTSLALLLAPDAQD